MLRKHIASKSQGEYGFTLIELLVVIIIIGILAAIAIPAFLNQRQQAQLAEAKSDVRNVATLLEQQAATRNAPQLNHTNVNFRNALTEANLLQDYNGANRKKTMALCSDRDTFVLVYWPSWNSGTANYKYVAFSSATGLETQQDADIYRNPANTYLLNDICAHVLPSYTFSQWSQTL